MLEPPHFPDEHFVDAALAASVIGPVFPVAEGAKSPPLLAGWPDLATQDRGTIVSWWMRPDGGFHRYNVGIATGNGIFVVDIDITGDDAAIGKVLEDFGIAGLETYQVRTARSGRHVYLRGAGVRNSVKRIHPKVDIRGRGGYVLAAGSVTPHGAYVAI